jgi:hypothetical protein
VRRARRPRCAQRRRWSRRTGSAGAARVPVHRPRVTAPGRVTETQWPPRSKAFRSTFIRTCTTEQRRQSGPCIVNHRSYRASAIQLDSKATAERAATKGVSRDVDPSRSRP